jgi:DegV family protein with EDD domain
MAEQCNLIFDSCCELPKDIWQKPGVSMLHFSYTDAGKNYMDDMYETISAHEFYENMRNGATPMTSQPAQSEIEDAFRAAIRSGVPTVYLAFSSGISGAYEGAMVALDRMKEEFGEDIPVHVVDLKVGSTPESLVCLEAIRQRDKGLSAMQMVEWAQEARYFVHTMFMVDDLEALRRGGRIPAGIAIAGAKLDVKPLLSFDIDGKLSLVGVARGRKKGLKRMADYFEKVHPTDEGAPMVAIGNADCPKDAEKLRDMIEHDHENALFLPTSIGPTIGCHVGPAMVSCCFWGSDRRESLSVSDRIANRVKSS